tara:strand:+ start:825 stop:1739 length:915 start_codon:yes stop_codon:yes gene_type:complete
MFELALSLAPIFLLIALGWAFRRGSFPQGEFWTAAERLVHFVLFPALLLGGLATADLSGFEVTPLIAAVAASVMVMALAVMVIGWKLVSDGPAFASVFQGSLRFNAYVGVAAAAALFGTAGETLAAVVIAVMVPLGEALSVVALARQAGRDTPSLGILFTSLLRNPLILASFAGIILNMTEVGLPSLSEPVVGFLGRAALPIGLLCVGAGLDVSALGKSIKPIIATSVLKLVVMPVFMLVACSAFGVGGLTAKVALLFAALPPSPPSHSAASQLGGDATLMSNLTTIATLAATVTLPAIMLVYD